MIKKPCVQSRPRTSHIRYLCAKFNHKITINLLVKENIVRKHLMSVKFPSRFGPAWDLKLAAGHTECGKRHARVWGINKKDYRTYGNIFISINSVIHKKNVMVWIRSQQDGGLQQQYTFLRYSVHFFSTSGIEVFYGGGVMFKNFILQVTPTTILRQYFPARLISREVT